MKKYLFGLFAIVFAVGAVAFTTPATSAKRVQYIFAFNTSLSPTETNVETPANWSLVADATGCSIDDERACKIKVDESDTEVVLGVRKLKSATSIIAAQFTTNVYYVTLAGDVVEKYNNENQ